MQIFRRTNKNPVSRNREIPISHKTHFQSNEGKKSRKVLVLIGYVLVVLGILGFLASLIINSGFLSRKSQLLSPVSTKVSEVQALAKILDTLGIAIKSKILDNGDVIEVTLVSGEEVLFPKKGDLTMKAVSLQMILVRFKIEGKRVKKIDLRFNKPIILD